MVEIEEETTIDVVKETKQDCSKNGSADDTGSVESEMASKDVLEGFETASEGDLDNKQGENGGDEGERESEENEGGEEQALHHKDDPYEDAFNDDELKQRALAQANDAKSEGNTLFKDGHYDDALLKYGLALQVAPEIPSSVELRSICHANRAACFLKQGNYQETVKECTKSLELNPVYEKALIRRAEAHERLEHYEEAIADNKKILELDPSNDHARRSIVRLEPLAREKMEKMKEEMIGKLKDLGNSVLGRFGMSVDNFKVVKDPNTGSSTIQYQP
ncbi:hypothetical protein V2J09_020721 [Rumex salicifolius]